MAKVGEVFIDRTEDGHGQFGELVGDVVGRLNCLQRRPRKGVVNASLFNIPSEGQGSLLSGPLDQTLTGPQMHRGP